MKTNQIRTDITDIVFVFILYSDSDSDTDSIRIQIRIRFVSVMDVNNEFRIQYKLIWRMSNTNIYSGI